MPNDIATVEEPGTALAPMRASDNLLAQVIAAAKDPTVDATKMETLARLVNTQQDREREIEFNRDLNAAIMEMPVITKDGRIVIKKQGEPEREQGRFARLEDIDRVCRPIARRHNLAYSWDVGDSGSGPVVAIILTHANGHQVTSSGMKMPLDTSGGKNNVQGAGSAVTYGKRYTLCARFNIQTEGADDDGNLGRGELVSLPHERAETVLAEAEEAHEAGTYPAFFGRQSPKDRGWLISNGHHVRFGGQLAIATDSPKPKPRAEREPEPDKPKSMTARQWVDQFKIDLGQCSTTDAAAEFMEEARESLDKLKATKEALWDEAQKAYRDRKTAIEEGRLV